VDNTRGHSKAGQRGNRRVSPCRSVTWVTAISVQRGPSGNYLHVSDNGSLAPVSDREARPRPSTAPLWDPRGYGNNASARVELTII
jgi:hypothetical protein